MRWVPAVAVVPVLLAMSAEARAADAADAPDEGAALFAGAATALVPFAVGTTMLAAANDTGQRNGGAIVAQAGLAFAPLVAHGVVSEWGRGLAFSAVPAACTVGSSVLLSVRPATISAGVLS